MNSHTLNDIPLNSYPSAGQKQDLYNYDAIIVLVTTKNYSVDAVLQGVFNRTYSQDAMLQGGSTKFYSFDSILADTYHDNGVWGRIVDIDLVQPINENRLAIWSTYSRPTNPVLNQAGINTQTGKIEYWDGMEWRNYDGTSA